MVLDWAVYFEEFKLIKGIFYKLMNTDLFE